MSDITAASAARKELERWILEHVVEYEAQYGVDVAAIDFYRRSEATLSMDGSRGPPQLEIEVRLRR